jgi:tetratricopeptide (TPR) repeat protein/tRNA A-37 threonylcarbamoyl transferase component Bud32
MDESTPRQPDGHTPGSGTIVGSNDSPPALLNTPPGPGDPTAAGSVPAAVGRFRVGEELARGGMGVVYRAEQPSVGRDVAVKVLHDHLRGDERMAARFVAEARITGQLQHPGVPPVHEVGELPDGRPFLAMKLIKGRTLADLLRARADPSADRGRFVAVFEQVCQAVGYAHSRGVIHRDLKPQNVMVGAFGEVQVMDWGLAKVLTDARTAELGPQASTLGTEIRSPRDADEATRAGSVMGTPAYMPREQAIGAVDQIDRRSDVFGLGAILCAILTGQPPYAAATGEAARQMAAVAQLGGAFARLDASGAEPDLVALCKRCLSPEKADRPRDGEEVAGAVDALRAAADERARRAELERERAEVRVVEQRKRARLRLALAVAVVLVAAGAAFAWWIDRHAAERARQGVRGNLALAVELRKTYRFPEAEAALAQAADLALGGAPELVPEVERARANLALVVKLDDIRMRRSTMIAGPTIRFDLARAVRDYPGAFRSAGLDVLEADPGVVAAAVAASPVRAELIAALDDWSALPLGEAAQGRVLDVLRRADPGLWLDAFRDPGVRRNRMALGLLARSADVARLPPPTLTALSAVMQTRGLDPSPLLHRAQFAHPSDFLIPFMLGEVAEDDADRVAYYRAARVARPTNRDVLTNLGICLEDTGDRDGAIAAYREAIKCDPTFATAHHNLGVALLSKGDVDGAIAAHREAIKHDPTFAMAHNGLGVALSRKGDRDGAIAAYREAIKCDPTFVVAHANLGKQLGDRGDFDGAIAAYHEAIKHHPAFAPAHDGLGNALRIKGDTEGAIAEFREATRADPTFAQAYTNLGVALKKKGDLDGAIAAHREAIRLDPRLALAHTNLGLALAARDEVDGAIAALREAIRLDPTFAPNYYTLGNALKSKKDRDGAIAAYQEAIRHNPGYAEAHTNLGGVYLAQKKYPEAIASARAAIKADPKLSNAHALLGDLLQRTGDLAGARAALTEAARLDSRWKPYLAKLPPVPTAPPPRPSER